MSPYTTRLVTRLLWLLALVAVAGAIHHMPPASWALTMLALLILPALLWWRA